MPPGLAADQVFQLNAVLWSLQDIRPESGIHPVLRDVGYYLRAIGRRLQVPTSESQLDAMRAVADVTDREPSHPDMWLANGAAEVEPIIELKAQSFGLDSTNTRQAAKILISAADLSPSLGVPGAIVGHAIYLTPMPDSPAMSTTLDQLADLLTEAGGSTATTASLGIDVTSDGVVLASPVPDRLPMPMREALSAPAVVLDPPAAGDSVQPLYFVPWIPGIEDSQDPDLHAEGLRELTARVLTHAISLVGTAKPPAMVVTSGADLLSRATFGVFAHWRDSDRRLFAAAAARIVERALSKTVSITEANGVLEIDLPTDESQTAAIERLEDADPSDPTRSLSTVVAEPPTLFD